MPIWLMKMCHAIGLTNLTDEEMKRYTAIRQQGKFSFTSAPIFSGFRRVEMTEAEKFAQETELTRLRLQYDAACAILSFFSSKPGNIDGEKRCAKALDILESIATKGECDV